MLDHIGIAVRDVDRARAFYNGALAPLGIGIIMEVTAEQTGNDAAVGYGAAGKPFFWIGEVPAPVSRSHVAFVAESRAVVDAFYKAAMAAGGTDNGGPGLRPHYHSNYYGAFVLDPDGHNIEAVCHRPE
ncbi:MAG: VOC family protein [Methylobacteriaceae bacterium]|nr:VOC family protein [Methylobacteriaceae bacterium]MBV9219015.1 VOC family protein [Methylobacteriaceae bacterium]MBV9246327.1 VOC family protein [Methylobacteriaceae bacterium]MBV9633940.1 VOC family protein [Methylobacteriaceae bacterium]